MRDIIVKMAWRDARKNRSRLLLFISSIVLGIATMVAISSFGVNLRLDIEKQAAELIGADLLIDSRKELSSEASQLIDSIKTLSSAMSEEKTFASMALFEKSGGSRLVQIRALSEGYPFYGRLETQPASAAGFFRSGTHALVDRSLMMQFDAEVGDQVKVGNVQFEIAGELISAPGRNGFSTTMAPAIYIPLELLEATGLAQKGSRITSNFYFQFAKNIDVDKLADQLDSRLDDEGLDAETIEMRKEDTGRAFKDLTGFLSLVGFIALLLGCIGVSSSIQIYLREKVGSIAVLRCLGFSTKQTFFIFLLQMAGIGLIGSLIGSGLGVLVQQMLPVILQDMLPVSVSNEISWMSVALGVFLGLCISVLFTLPPLMNIYNVSPLYTLRASFEEGKVARNPLTVYIYAAIVLLVLGFSRFQLDNWLQSIWFTCGVLAGFGLLYGVSHLLIVLVKKYFPYSWSYLWRQGLSNLFRPNNQTTVLIMAIGLGTSFIATLFFVKGLLINQILLSDKDQQPNMVLFDIQSSQKDEAASLIRNEGLPVLQQVPIVTIQLQEINGYNASDVEKDSTLRYSSRAFGRELRVTFRDSLISSEKITAGEWTGVVNVGDTARISLDRGYADRLGVEIGDLLLYNVQGVLIPAYVGSFREVDWNRVQTNFRVVFPKGAIDNAPQFHVLMTRAPDEKVAADVQLKLLQRFPTISVIDLNLILSVLDEIFSKVSFVIQFMAALSIITGIIVLISSIIISRFQRIRESVLLRTLGASRKQVLIITMIEYFILGALASITGIVIALLASWALAVFSFELPFRPDILLMFALIAGVSLLTTVIGTLNSWFVLNRPPLEVLRKET